MLKHLFDALCSSVKKDVMYSESSKKGYIIVIYEELKEFGYFVVEENTNV